MRFNRIVATAAVLALGIGLSACETSDFTDKIQDKLNDMNLFGSNKKPLPGERREVFPGGAVPGVSQGVPPDLMPGGQQANAQPVQAPPQPAPPPVPVKKKKRIVAKKKNPPRTSAPPPDGVWPPPPNSNSPAPPPENSVWPPPPK